MLFVAMLAFAEHEPVKVFDQAVVLVLPICYKQKVHVFIKSFLADVYGVRLPFFIAEYIYANVVLLLYPANTLNFYWKYNVFIIQAVYMWLVVAGSLSMVRGWVFMS